MCAALAPAQLSPGPLRPELGVVRWGLQLDYIYDILLDGVL